jgi:FtsH-binding integral membrane protein
MTTLTPTDARQLRSDLHAQDRAWRAGFEAGLREHHRLVVVGLILAAVVLLRRHLHPVLGLLFALALLFVLWPLVAVVLAVEVTRREQRRWHSWRRTLALGATWATGMLLVFVTIAYALPALVLVLIPLAVLAWWIDERVRLHRQLRYVAAPEHFEPFVD